MNTAVQIVILMKRLGWRSIGNRANRLLSLCLIVCTCVAASLSFFATSVESALDEDIANYLGCLLYTSPSPRDGLLSRMPSSA